MTYGEEYLFGCPRVFDYRYNHGNGTVEPANYHDLWWNYQVADVVRTTLGLGGMEKLILDDKGNTTISNDSAAIMKLLDIVHPAAKILVDIAKSQDSKVGDGTATVVLLAGEFLKEAKPFIEDRVHPQNLIRSYRNASYLMAC